jgi:hypothetical protein
MQRPEIRNHSRRESNAWLTPLLPKNSMFIATSH